MKNITTTEIFAIRLLERIQKRYGFNLAECQINWAMSEMLRGMHSTSLHILAGMSSLDNPFEVDAHFLKTLSELNIEIPTKQKAIKNYVLFVCKNIVEKNLSEHTGCEFLADVCKDLQYQAYYDWYELLEKLDMGLITKVEFEKLVQEKARNYLLSH